MITAQVGELVAVEPIERATVEHHRARGRPFQAGEQKQQRSLAGTDGPAIATRSPARIWRSTSRRMSMRVLPSV